MKSYTVPEVFEGMSPEEATAALEALWADVGGDAAHPYACQAHPKHKRFVAAAQALYAMKNSPPELGSPVSDEEQADIAAEIATLEATPGYVNGKLRQQSLAAYTRLVGKIHALYERAAQGRLAAERAVAEDAEIDPDEAADRAAEAELARAVERVQEAEVQEDESEQGEPDDDDDEL